MPTRRMILATLPAFLPAAALAADGGASAVANNSDNAPNVAVFCDEAMADAVRHVTEGFIAPVHVFVAPPASLRAMIARDTQTDLLITGAENMSLAIGEGNARAPTRMDRWRTRHALVARAGTPATAMTSMIAGLAKGGLALTDPTPASGFDGRAVLADAGIAVPEDRLIGVARSEDAAFLVATGVAAVGLLPLPQARTNPRLTVIATLDGPPLTYAAALTRQAKSRNSAALLAFLAGQQVDAGLTALGVEIAA